jgi:hypothetical protein
MFGKGKCVVGFVSGTRGLRSNHGTSPDRSEFPREKHRR